MILFAQPSTDFGASGLGRDGIGAVQQIPALDQRLHQQGEGGLTLDRSPAPPLHLLQSAGLLGVADAFFDAPRTLHPTRDNLYQR
jgi:hypothetical protein